MFRTNFIVLITLCVLGIVTAHVGGFIHTLQLLAITAGPIRIIQGRRPVV
jgi:hypothetical protein